MTKAAKHILVYIAAVGLMGATGSLPLIILRPGIYGGLSPLDVLLPETPDFESLLRTAPLLLVLALAQRAVFRTRLKHPALVFLGGVALLWSVFAWFGVWLIFFSNLDH